MKRFLLLLTLCALPFVCQAKVKGYYRVTLQSVESCTHEGEITNVLGVDHFTYPMYVDENIEINFQFQPTHIDFTLLNRGNSNIRIIWDNAVYVGGPNSVSDGVFHSGVKLIDRNNPQTPTVVMKGSRIADLLVLKSGVSFSSSFGRWMYNYILYWQDSLKNIKILLPLEIDGVVCDYIFNFSVQWEEVKVKTRIYDGKEYYIQMK